MEDLIITTARDLPSMGLAIFILYYVNANVQKIIDLIDKHLVKMHDIIGKTLEYKEQDIARRVELSSLEDRIVARINETHVSESANNEVIQAVREVLQELRVSRVSQGV